MRSLRPSFIATSALLGLVLLAPALLVAPAKAGAQSFVAPAAVVAPAKAGAQSPAGTVTHLDGPLFVQKADGRTRVIATGASVDAGDTLVTGHGAYAEIHFADKSDAILQPDTQLTVDAFSADASRGAHDTARWTLAQGGMQVTSGEIASSGAGRHTIATPYGTIGVGPSRFFVSVTPAAAAPLAMAQRVYLAANSSGIVSDVPQPIFVAQATPLPPPAVKTPNTGAVGVTPPPSGSPAGGTLPPTPPGLGTPLGPSPLPLPPGGSTTPPLTGPLQSLPPGLHLQVTDGAIVVTNSGGSQGFQAGQFGYVPSVNQPPVIVPSNPGVQFVPPPSFNSGSGGPTASNGPGSGQTVDCVVR